MTASITSRQQLVRALRLFEKNANYEALVSRINQIKISMFSAQEITDIIVFDAKSRLQDMPKILSALGYRMRLEPITNAS